MDSPVFPPSLPASMNLSTRCLAQACSIQLACLYHLVLLVSRQEPWCLRAILLLVPKAMIDRCLKELPSKRLFLVLQLLYEYRILLA